MWAYCISKKNLRALLPHIIIFIVLILFIYLILNCLGLTTTYYGYAMRLNSLPHFEYFLCAVSLMPKCERREKL